MRSFLLKASLASLLLIVLISLMGMGLATAAPFKPGNLFFPLQDFFEQQRSALLPDPQLRADYQLELAERRLRDLVTRTGSQYEIDALTALERAIDRAAQSISALPETEAEKLRTRLHGLVNRANAALQLLTVVNTQDAELYNAFESKLQALLAMLADPQAVVSNLGFIIDMPTAPEPQTVPLPEQLQATVIFPPGSFGAEHTFYPLLGQHAALDCAGCHASGVYQGTPKACVICHVMDAPVDHFLGDCASCHNPADWLEVDFDHSLAGSKDCISCHASTAPTGHFSGQCSRCHLTTNWQTVNFDHTGFTNCKSCHAGDVPTNHYAGQCSSCHSTGNWANVTFGWPGARFDHSGQADCKSCHASDAPGGHYAGQCSSCHTTNGWPGASFNHSGQTDCKSCHAGDAPGGHYAGQCSSCHTTNGWPGASFSHSGQTDCKSCHAGDAPGGHYSGQCSSCHTTSGWGNVQFSHQGQTDCIGCHLKDRPDEHDKGQCSECHNTNKWGDAEDSAGSTNAINAVFPGIPCANCHSGTSQPATLSEGLLTSQTTG